MSDALRKRIAVAVVVLALICVTYLLAFHGINTTTNAVLLGAIVFFGFIITIGTWSHKEKVKDRIWSFIQATIAALLGFTLGATNALNMTRIQNANAQQDQNKRLRYMVAQEMFDNLAALTNTTTIQYTTIGLSNTVGLNLISISSYALEDALRTRFFEDQKARRALDIIRQSRLHKRLVDTYLDVSFRGTANGAVNLVNLRDRAGCCIWNILSDYHALALTNDPNMLVVATAYWGTIVETNKVGAIERIHGVRYETLPDIYALADNFSALERLEQLQRTNNDTIKMAGYVLANKGSIPMGGNIVPFLQSVLVQATNTMAEVAQKRTVIYSNMSMDPFRRLPMITLATLNATAIEELTRLCNALTNATQSPAGGNRKMP